MLKLTRPDNYQIPSLDVRRVHFDVRRVLGTRLGAVGSWRRVRLPRFGLFFSGRRFGARCLPLLRSPSPGHVSWMVLSSLWCDACSSPVLAGPPLGPPSVAWVAADLLALGCGLITR